MTIHLETKPENQVQDLTNPEFYYDDAYRNAGNRIRIAEEDRKLTFQFREERILVQHFLAKNLLEADSGSLKQETNQWPPITPIQTFQVIRNSDIEEAINQSEKLADQRLKRYLDSFIISHGVEPDNSDVRQFVKGAKDMADWLAGTSLEKEAA